MTDSRSIQQLLERAADDHVTVDVAGDLRRGRRALARRRTRLAMGVTAGLVAAGAASYAVLPRSPQPVVVHPADGGSLPSPAPQPVRTDYFVVPQPPAGWHVVGARSSYAMISRDGSGADLDSTFTDQLMVLLEDKSWPMDDGTQHTYDGRTFYDNEQNDGLTILSVQQPDGDWLQLQYPHSAGFDLGAMIEYLDQIQVLPGASGAQG